jgi:hypothetical protein
MKKNILLSIALCFELLIPHASFASETGHGLYETLRSGFSRGAQALSSYLPEAPSVPTWAKRLVNRLSDNQKLALFTALATALGYYVHSSYQSKPSTSSQLTTEPDIIPQTKTDTPISTKSRSPKVSNFYNNIALFLTHKEYNARTEEELTSLFVNDICPILKKLNPRRIDSRFWKQLIRKARWENERTYFVPLNYDNVHYLKIIKEYANTSGCLLNPALSDSLQEAIDHMSSSQLFEIK